MADIVLDGVIKRYPDGFEAVKDLNLSIADGEFMILVGPSGCGKSTALNMIAGLEDISAGELRIEGKVVNQVAPRDRDIAMVFQSYALYPHMTVRENMAFALKLKKTPKEEVDRKVGEAAEILDLNEHLERKPANLSGGQRQRVAMGRAIVRDPKAFLMDEPLSNLDAKLRVQMRAEVARIQHRLNTTTVYVTHDQTEAMTLGDRVAVMLSGFLQQVGSPMELYNNPVNLFVAGFIGSPGMNFMPATVKDGVAHLPMAEVTLPQAVLERMGRGNGGARNLIAGIRPEDFEDATKVERDARARGTTFQTKLDLVEAMGAEFYAHFGVDAGRMQSADLMELRDDQGGVGERSDSGDTVVVARLSPESRARTGEPSELWLDASKLHFFDADSGQSLTYTG
jgi:multiple sugar transport system ATP-binding protein